MKIGTVKEILIISRQWNVPALLGDVPHAYAKVEKEKDLEIFMRIPSGMQVSQDILDEHGVKDTKHLAM